MPTEFKRAVFKSGDSYRITIPMPIIQSLEIKEKEILKIWQDDSHIILTKVKK
jgi:bifunctional DNA-binding transcriptional regulator/antitoxin component of YhaV-PrlF toxin-antitoxin module